MLCRLVSSVFDVPRHMFVYSIRISLLCPGEEGYLLASQLLQKAAMRSATQQQLLPAETSLTRHRPNGPARKLLAPDAEDERAHAPAEGKRLADEILAARKAKKAMMAWSA